MPWLANPPASQNQPQSTPPQEADAPSPAVSDPNDPDAENLPPGVILPEAAQYRLQQIKAQVINFALMTAFVLLWSLLVIRDNPTVGIICTALAASGLALALLRLWFARRSYIKQQNP